MGIDWSNVNQAMDVTDAVDTPPARTTTQVVKPSTSNLAECWECKKPIGRTAKACPHCGADPSKRPAPEWAFWASLITVALFVIIGAVAFVKSANKDRELREFEDQIRREYGDK